MLKRDQLYKDILDGLSLFYKSRFINDVRNTALHFPIPTLGFALNRKQTTSKLWLLDKLFECYGGNLGSVYILGGWYCVLGALIFHDPRFKVIKVISIDLNPNCAPIANSLNATSSAMGVFEPLTADILNMKYGETEISIDNQSFPPPSILINTSCEHIADFSTWFKSLPNNVLLVLQSNNYFSEPEHVNSVPNLSAFKQLAPLGSILYEGALELDKYTRFMLIGEK